jgi:UDP-N-acetyl-D-glucosamine dehydrogenase
MSHFQSLLSRIESRDALIGVVGMGYVGLPLAVAFGETGFSVLGFDVDEEVVRGVRGGRSHVGDVPDDTVASAVATGRLAATDDLERLSEPDVIVICVPTPLSKTEERRPNHCLAVCAQVSSWSSSRPRTPVPHEI